MFYEPVWPGPLFPSFLVASCLLAATGHTHTHTHTDDRQADHNFITKICHQTRYKAK